MYKIIGSDQKEYGPITDEQLRQWIAQRRANGQSYVLPDGATEWKQLLSLPEFSAALAAIGASAPALPGAAPADSVKTSRLAVASMVLGILGFCGITGLIGFILGIVALIKINSSNGRLRGQGFAIAGLILPVVMIPIIAIMAGLFLPALARAKAKAQAINCVNNLKQIGLAARMYANANKEVFPLAATWCDTLQPDLGGPILAAKILKCKADANRERSSYGYNIRLSGKNVSEVNPQTVMFFETEGGWNVSGGPELLVKRGLHLQKINVCFADGSVQQVPFSQVSQLRWNP